MPETIPMSSSSPSLAEAPPAGADFPALRASGLWDVLSERGRRAVLHEGIRTWVERARAADVDATIGVLAGTAAELAECQRAGTARVATPAGTGATAGAGERAGIFYLSPVREHFPELAPPEIFPYTPVAGARAFREGWRNWLLKKCAAVADPGRVRALTTLPIATPGVTGGLFAAGHLFLDPGEAMVAADKRWDGYDTVFETVLGARLTAHRLFTPEGRLDMAGFADRLREVAGRQPKVTAILNFPNNPTGYMPSAAEAAELTERVRGVLEETGKPLVVLFDDAYEGYVYDDAHPVSLFYGFVGLHPLCWPVKCDGITKELLLFGGRLGALTLGLPESLGEGPAAGSPDRRGNPAAVSPARREKTIGSQSQPPPGEGSNGTPSIGGDAHASAPDRATVEAEWENKVAAVLRAIISSAPTPVQGLVTHVLRDDMDVALAERARMIELLRRRRERLMALLETPEARAVFRVDPFNSGFFAFLNLRSGSAEEVAFRALREHRVGVVPMESAELGINALRVTFGSVPEAQLERLVRALVTSAGG
jgi:aspartate/methionine/tyrosine aminotransferase